MRTLKDLLDELLKPTDRWQDKLIRDWPTFVGDLHQRMRLEKILVDTLQVGVNDVRWVHELHCLSAMLIDHINKKLGGSFIKKIVFRVARPRKELKKSVQNVSVSYNEYSLSPQESSVLDTIKDKDLQKALHQYRIKCH